MAEEFLARILLKGEKAVEKWDPESLKHDNEEIQNQHFGVDQKLVIKMAILGPEAAPGELNVVQVEAMGLKGPVSTPIALLEMGKTAQVTLDLSFSDPPVTFSLIKGKGPVHIVGHNLIGTHIDEFEEMEEEMEDEAIDDDEEEKDLDDEDDEEEEPKKKNSKVFPGKNRTQAIKKQKK